MQGDAGRVVLDFAGHNELQKVHALDGAHLTQQAAAGNKQPQQDAAAAGFRTHCARYRLHGRRWAYSGTCCHFWSRANHNCPGAGSELKRKANGPAHGRDCRQVRRTLRRSRWPKPPASVHGAPNAHIVNSNPGQPDRVSTSESVDAILLPQGGLDSVTQQGNVAYTDGQPPDKRMQAWANTARYTPADQMLVLTGNPRVINGGMADHCEDHPHQPGDRRRLGRRRR